MGVDDGYVDEMRGGMEGGIVCVGLQASIISKILIVRDSLHLRMHSQTTPPFPLTTSSHTHNLTNSSPFSLDTLQPSPKLRFKPLAQLLIFLDIPHRRPDSTHRLQEIHFLDDVAAPFERVLACFTQQALQISTREVITFRPAG
jgi:hypothetical protein